MSDLLTPLDRFLREQQDLTPVERFAQRHAADQLSDSQLGDTLPRYRDLLPGAGPGPGEQYAFDVDLDACSGCKACVSACHSLNGLDEAETWRSVGLLHGLDPVAPQLQTVTTACHHCVDPACLNGCPVDAYEKDPITGIVAHLDDQCIGCQYCTLMCPYEVPVYDAGRGIVRKCDLCRDRLNVGEAPACVQGCPTDAISVTVVSTLELVAQARASTASRPTTLVPTAPDSSITVPSTRYRSARPLASSMVAGDQYSLQPAHGHTPLAVMLVLTQLAVGTAALALVLGDRITVARSWSVAVTLLVGVVALGASVGHLGRPWYAWRAVLGLGHSWLSREIVAFGVFAGLTALDAAATAAGTRLPAWLAPVLADAVVAAGVVGVVCSVLIYAATRRRWWRAPRTGALFGASALVTGGATLLAVSVASAAGAGGLVGARGAVRPLVGLVVVASLLKLVLELSVLRHRHLPSEDRALEPAAMELHRTARLLSGDLAPQLSRRVIAGVFGGVILPLVLLAAASSATPTVPAIVMLALASPALIVVAELTERRLFFLAMSGPRMPGVLR